MIGRDWFIQVGNLDMFSTNDAKKPSWWTVATMEARGMKKRTTMKHWAIAISLMILGGGMSACAGGSAKWKEEVQLSDGRIIVIEREMITEGG